MLGNSGRGMVFITGSVRSGTTAVRQGLGASVGRKCRDEDGLGRIYASIGESVREHLDEQALQVGCENLEKANGNARWLRFVLEDGLTRELSRVVMEEEASHWIGFSPDFNYPAHGVRSIPRIAEIFPEARFVFCRRHGIANVESRMRRWPDTPFMAHCVAWSMIMDEWQRVRSEVGDRSIEVDQLEMLRDPEGVGDGIADLVELDDEPGDVLVETLRRERPQASATQDQAQYPRLDEIGWPVDQKLAFIAACHTPMQSFGYETGFPGAQELSALLLTLDGEEIEVERRDTDFAPWALLGFPGGFQLHPAAAHQPPPTIVFRNVPGWGASALRGTLLNVHPEAPTIEFELRVRLTGTERVAYANRFSVGPVSCLTLNENFNAGTENVDVEIATRVGSSGSNSNAWARLAGLRVTPAQAAA